MPFFNLYFLYRRRGRTAEVALHGRAARGGGVARGVWVGAAAVVDGGGGGQHLLLMEHARAAPERTASLKLCWSLFLRK